MKTFWKFLLRKNLPNGLLSNLRFAVLGLGDSSYTKFNFAAKRLNRRLTILGAKMLIPLGLGDDQHDMGYDAVVDPWIESLYGKLCLLHPLPDGLAPLDRNNIFKPRWHVDTFSNINNNLSFQSIYFPTRTDKDFLVTVKDIVKTTSKNHFQDVRLIKLQTCGQSYLPGDVVVIRPKNIPKQIEEFQTLLKSTYVDVQSNTILKIIERSSEVPVPLPLQYEVTFQQLCEEYFDLNAVPRRHVFQILSQLTDSEIEKEKLTEFVSAEGQNDLYNYCNRPHRNILEVLQDFPHALKHVTKDTLFDIFPPIKPREFSIASSFKAHINEIHILLGVVRYKTKLVKERLGLCSNYLANMKIGDKITVWIKKGSFRFPKDLADPVILVGPGTGMAPFRSLICERVHEEVASDQSIVFFFGCRNFLQDFHCKEDFIQFERENKIKLICAFSRDQDHKIYVQHKIVENGDLLWDLLKNRNAYIFVAGNAKNMPGQVREAFITVCMDNGKLSYKEGVQFIENLEKLSRYQTETW
ncbi:hypothetical protein FQA39_LY15328 [Lamprigera yunnana]|nr:hypothetical protein FQA39_LY15328 [Lamprigera yunnana]